MISLLNRLKNQIKKIQIKIKLNKKNKIKRQINFLKRCKELEEMQRHAKEESGGARTSKPNKVVG